jgi:hypothetical protein
VVERVIAWVQAERDMRFGMMTVLGAIISSWLVTQSAADITTLMQAWEFLPLVQITQGRNHDCGLNRNVYNGSMTKGHRQTWAGTGTRGEDICWRRTADPFKPSSALSPWTRCATDEDCEIR